MVKIGDIAKEVGFSVTTVSKALNGYSDISEATKKIVIDKAKEMGYIPNANARSLVMKKTFTIGVILDDITGYGLEHPFFAGVIQSFRSTVEKKGYDVLFIANEIGQSPVDNYYNHCRQRGVDGVMILCTNIENEGVKELLGSTIPSIIFDMPNVDYDGVYSDHYVGAREAVEHLIKLGHKKIAHIYGEDVTYAGYQRRKAYMDVMMENHLPIKGDYMQDGGFFDFQESKVVMGQILNLKERPTAVFVAGDVMALGAMQCCYERHIRIPDDISIIGFDNIRLLEWTTPRLTSVAQDLQKLGSECGALLIQKIENPKIKDRRYIKVPTHLVIGSTCREV